MRRKVDHQDYQTAGSPSREMESSGRRLSGGQHQPSSLTIGSRSTSKSSSTNSDSWQQSFNSHDSLGEMPVFPRRGSSADFDRDPIVSGVPSSPSHDDDDDLDLDHTLDLDSPPPPRQHTISLATHEEFSDEDSHKAPRRNSLVRWADEEGAAPLEHHAPAESLTADEYFEALLEPLQRELDVVAVTTPSPDGILRDKGTARKSKPRSSTDAEIPLNQEENPSTGRPRSVGESGERRKKKKKKKSSSSEGQDDATQKKKKKKKKRRQIQAETEGMSFNEDSTQLLKQASKKESDSVSTSVTDTYDTVSLSTESSALYIPTTRTRAVAANVGNIPDYKETEVFENATEGETHTRTRKGRSRSVSFGPSGHLEENYEYDPTGPVQRHIPSDTSPNNSAAAPQLPRGVLRGAQSGLANRKPNNRRTSFAADVFLPPQKTSSVSSPATQSPPSSPTPGKVQVAEPSRRTSFAASPPLFSSVSTDGSRSQSRLSSSFGSSHRSQRRSFGGGNDQSISMDNWDDHSTAGASLAGGVSVSGMSVGGASTSSHFSRRTMNLMMSQRNSALSLAATSETSDSRDGNAKKARNTSRGSRTTQIFDQTGHVLSETEMVTVWKLNGKCTTCGLTRTHYKTKYGPFKAFRRMTGITVTNKVYKGYCLGCHRINDVKIFLGEEVSIDPEENSSISTPHTNSTPGEDDALSPRIDPESQRSPRIEDDEDEAIYESILSGAAMRSKSTHPYETSRQRDDDPMMIFQDSTGSTNDQPFAASFTTDTFAGHSSISTEYMMTAKDRLTLGQCMSSLQLRTLLMLACVGLFGGLITLAINITRDQADVSVDVQIFPPTVSPTLGPTISAAPSIFPSLSPTYLDWQQLGQDIVETDIESFGFKVELNNNGNRLAVSAPLFQQKLGRVVVYEHPTLWSIPTALNNDTWVLLGQPILGEMQNDNAGWGMDLSGDGSTLAVGFPGNGNGYVRVYRYDHISKEWKQKGNTITGTQADSGFGRAIDLSLDGDDIVIGAEFFNGPNGMNAGQVTVYKFDSIGMKWDIHGNQMDGDDDDELMGHSVAIGRDGHLVVIGSPENSDKSFHAGRIWFFVLEEVVLEEVDGVRLEWELADRRESGKKAGDRLGHVVRISEQNEVGNYILAAASPNTDYNETRSDVGKVDVYKYGTHDEDDYPVTHLDFIKSFDDENVAFEFGNDFDMSGDHNVWVIAEADERVAPGKVHLYIARYYGIYGLKAESSLDMEGFTLGPTRSANGGPSVSAADDGQIAVGFESVIFPDSNIPTSLVRVYDYSQSL